MYRCRAHAHGSVVLGRLVGILSASYSGTKFSEREPNSRDAKSVSPHLFQQNTPSQKDITKLSCDSRCRKSLGRSNVLPDLASVDRSSPGIENEGG